ncbi:MAG: UDP-N-acetylmuramate dehydrogenase [Halothiobacillaceae bacterium]|nr:MAG: UDP-N-acetylmuramate dehydrogenase [Halothiobacillaceae bacterium]
MMVAQQRIRLRGVLKFDEPLSRHTTWRVGGGADRFYTPADVADLSEFLTHYCADNQPILWLGLGSNLLVRDGGIRGTVINTKGTLDKLIRVAPQQVKIEAGVPCAKAARYCAKEQLVGAEFLAGIPGTVGGALAMNAGAFGGEIWDFVAAVETIDRAGIIRTRLPSDYQIAYRQVVGAKDEWFVAAYLNLLPGDGAVALLRIKQLLEQRNASQPMGYPTCGSVFRNPEGDHAGRLIEASGLKGFCIGGACVAEKHANFIINMGTATAADIEKLIQHVALIVQQRCGVTLTPEVHIVGEAW